MTAIPLSERLEVVRERVARACRVSGRNAADVSVICVTKNARPADVAEAVRRGWYLLGENRVADAEERQAAVSGMLTPEELTRVQWHMIGHLQTNKAARAVRWAAMIQSVDSLRLAQVIDRAAAQRGCRIACLAQINISEEQTKFGVRGEHAAALLEGMEQLSRIDCCGLMGIAPQVGDPEQSRPYFVRLRQFAAAINSRRRAQGKTPLSMLSMGMSDDFEVAIQEGATMVRIGRAIFGG